jgi:tRNA (guanine26-N2/guanine27-N2)-dimethyltransferase
MERVREGGVVVRVPEQPEAGAGEGVFYNPDQEFNRDVTVAVLRAFRERAGGETYLDATTATGVRGVRAAADGWDATCLDVDPDAVELARANFRANDVAGAVRRRDANVELHRNRYDAVDVDPFGSPIPFADAAFRGTRKLLCVTATDTAPLCGAHFDAGVRRYGAVPRNTEYHAEVGVRVLLSALARTGARYDVAATPILTHATRHYVRTYLELDTGGGVADDAIAELGYVHHCPECLYRESERGLIAHPPEGCPSCSGDQVVTAGPIWLGPIRERAFASAVAAELDDAMGTREEARKLLSTLEAELDVPTHYDQHRLCKRWGRAAGPMDDFLDALLAAGFSASRTHYGGTTFKTDADVASIREATGE